MCIRLLYYYTLRDVQVHWAWKLHVAYEVSLGMNYLHTARDRPVIHGDLKINNILISYGYHAKVSNQLVFI